MDKENFESSDYFSSIPTLLGSSETETYKATQKITHHVTLKMEYLRNICNISHNHTLETSMSRTNINS
jgi:hypothetical protein